MNGIKVIDVGSNPVRLIDEYNWQLEEEDENE